MLPDNNKQKSSSRRFLLILGAVVFVAIFAWGLMVIFDDHLFPYMPKTQKIAFGVLILIYAVLRISRIVMKKKADEV
jgi:peptidoglycan/LPS O-acetylase OafA/YrhL